MNTVREFSSSISELQEHVENFAVISTELTDLVNSGLEEINALERGTIESEKLLKMLKGRQQNLESKLVTFVEIAKKFPSLCRLEPK